MLKYIRGNIDKAQKTAYEQVNSVLEKRGYLLVKDDHYNSGIETRTWQWCDKTENCVQLAWDGKEQWFHLSHSISLEPISLQEITVVPFNITKLFFRDRYIQNKVNSILRSLEKEKSFINRIHLG